MENYSFALFAYTFPFFFIINIIVLVGLIFTKNVKYIIYPILAVIFTINIAADVFSIFPRLDNSEENQNSIRIVTWNVGLQSYYDPEHRKVVYDSIISSIKNFDPDVVCLQEFVAGKDTTIKLVFSMYDIMKGLDMNDEFYAFDTVFNLNKSHHYGNIILSKHPIIYRERINFDSLIYNNSFSYVDILKDGTKLRVANFHLESLRLQGSAREMASDPSTVTNRDSIYEYSKSVYQNILGSYNRRVIQANAISELIESTNIPVIVCGDMNDVPSSYAYRIVRDKLGDAFLKSGDFLGRTYDSKIPNLRIDYIFYSLDFFKISDYTVKKLSYSDHFPVFAELTY